MMGDRCPERWDGAAHCFCVASTAQHLVTDHACMECCWCGKSMCVDYHRGRVEGRGPDDHDCDKGGHCYVAEEKLMAEIFNGSFSVRIPASIEKAEGLLNGEHECERIGFYITNVGVNTVVFTANQLALAKAAAGLACAYTWDVNGTQRIDDCGDCERCASLIEFCETVESL